MARSHAKLLAAIWQDPEWRALRAEAQWLYTALLSQPRLTLVGALDLKPRQWAKLASDMTEERVTDLLAELEAARFVLVDEDTEELIIRTFVRHDVTQARLNVNTLKGLWRAFDAVASDHLRRQLVENLPGWVWEDSRAKPAPAALAILAEGHETAGHDGWNGPIDRTDETDRSDDPLEPPVRTSLSPIPSLSSRPGTPTGRPVRTDRSSGPIGRTDPVAGTVAAATAIAERNRRRDTGEACEVCADTGVTLDGLGHASPCPACHQGPIT